MLKKKKNFKDLLQQVTQNNVEKLIDRARTANRMAKLLKGKARISAYAVKHNALVSLAYRFPEQVSIERDLVQTELLIINFKKSRSGLHIPKNEFISRVEGK